MINYNNISVKYTKEQVLSIPHLSLLSNKVYGVIGKNGSGKSTLLKCTLNLIPFGGKVLIKHKDNQKDQTWKKITGSYIGEEQIIDFLTPSEYLDFIAKIRAVELSSQRNIFERLMKFSPPELMTEKKKIKQYSKGNIQKVGILGSLIGNPEIWLLDEPFSHLDETSCKSLINFINWYKQQRLIIIVDHNIDYLLSFCDTIIVLKEGAIDTVFEQPEFANHQAMLTEFMSV